MSERFARLAADRSLQAIRLMDQLASVKPGPPSDCALVCEDLEAALLRLRTAWGIRESDLDREL